MSLQRDWNIIKYYQDFIKQKCHPVNYEGYFYREDFLEVYNKYVNRKDASELFCTSIGLEIMEGIVEKIDIDFFHFYANNQTCENILLLLEDSHLEEKWGDNSRDWTTLAMVEILSRNNLDRDVKEIQPAILNMAEKIQLRIEREYLKQILTKNTNMNIKDLNNIICDYL